MVSVVGRAANICRPTWQNRFCQADGRIWAGGARQNWAEVWVGKHLIGMIVMISDTSYLYAIMRPVHELITLNFTRLEKVQNKSNRYFWKCNHCGDADGSRGAQIQGHDNNLANHLKECLKAPQEARKDACVFLSNKVQTEGSGPLDVLPSMNSSGTSSSSQAVTESGRSGNLAVAAVSGVKKRKSNSLIGYVDVVMTKEQAARANSKLIWYVSQSHTRC